MFINKYHLFGTLCLGFGLASCNEQSMSEKPNVVFILIDDLGYFDVGYMKQKQDIRTPHLDKLAEEGMVFTNAYTTSPVCSPTRASILTGKYPAKLKITCHIPGYKEWYMRQSSMGKRLQHAFFLDRLPLTETTVAEVLRDVGYKTCFIGKWHLAGSNSVFTEDGIVFPEYHPEYQGFDINIAGCALGGPKSYFSPYSNGMLPDGPEGEYLTDRLANEAVQFIGEHSGSPFFLYLSTYTVHTPLQAPEETINRHDGNVYHAMIEEMDKNVGRVLMALEESGVAQNTIVIFYSDNGGLFGNEPLRAIKGDLYEGGIKVPLIIKWPGITQKGTVNDALVTSTDFFPTLVDIVGLDPKDYPDTDGISLKPLLTGSSDLDRDVIFWHFPHHRTDNTGDMGAAIRDGDWKLIYFFERDQYELFNLSDDPGETINLSVTMPEKVNELYTRLSDWWEEMDAEMPPVKIND